MTKKQLKKEINELREQISNVNKEMQNRFNLINIKEELKGFNPAIRRDFLNEHIPRWHISLLTGDTSPLTIKDYIFRNYIDEEFNYILKKFEEYKIKDETLKKYGKK